MNKTLAITVLISALAFCGTACGKKDAAPDAAAAAQPAVPAVPPPSADAAENLGKKIGSSYIETLKQIVAILKDKPAAVDARAMLSDMKNWTIELMVNLGKEREALSIAERATVDRILSNRISSVPADVFKDYQAGQALFKDDRELFNLIADFNIITQYACFDLLKKQLPAEAERLGIK